MPGAIGWIASDGTELTGQMARHAAWDTWAVLRDAGQSVNAGFAVDAWRHSPFGSGTDAFSGQAVSRIFSITLEGRIVFTAVPAIPAVS
jgi:hypothetical protein